MATPLTMTRTSSGCNECNDVTTTTLRRKMSQSKGYKVTQPRGQPASAFEYSGCTHAPPGC